MRSSEIDSATEDVKSTSSIRQLKKQITVRRLIFSGVLLIALAAGFFFGRRLYYRMIQPRPLWTVPTPKAERIVCDESLIISLWADETLVQNPTSLAVDARGRVWVSEAVNYRDWQNHQRETGQAFQEEGDRIVILEDSNGDGRADKCTVFVQDVDLVAPTGICVLGNRVFVSCSPSIYVFTDDDGDDRADRKEVLLTGFGGHDHDHGVHSIVPGPDGRLYFAVGNAGPHIVTDRDGWTLRSGSMYQSGLPTKGSAPASGQNSEVTRQTSGLQFNSGGLVSDDGRIYAGGLVLSVNPDGSDLKVHSHNARNPYEVGVDSFGDIWQTDNDDTVSCRMTWLMNGSNTGFASADGNRSWQADQRPGQSIAEAHWHQADPGVLPAGEIYGTGAPTGLMRYESDKLGENLRGAILACDSGLGCVFAFFPVAEGAGFGFRKTRLIWSESLEDNTLERPDGLALTWFRPTDIAASHDGQLYIADWYDSYVGAHRVNDEQAAGRIYVVRPRENPEAAAASQHHATDAALKLPADSIASGVCDEEWFGLAEEIAALKSNAAAVRWGARSSLIERGAESVPPLRKLLNHPDLYVQARALWALSELGESGRELVRGQLGAADHQLRITALRALLAAGEPALELVTQLVNDSSAAVRREATLALRGLPPDDTDKLLIQLATQIDGSDRTAIEAFGLACEGSEEALFPELYLRLGNEPENWSTTFASIVWRLHPGSALPQLRTRLGISSLSPEERKRTVDAMAFMATAEAVEAIARFANAPLTADPQHAGDHRSVQHYAGWWKDRLAESGFESTLTTAASAAELTIRFVPSPEQSIDDNLIDRIASLDGDIERGQSVFASTRSTCVSCHRMHGSGGDIGPELTNIAQRLNRRQLIESIVYPSSSILTGYESWTMTSTEGQVFSGLLSSVGNEIVLRAADGRRHAVQRSTVEELIRHGTSIMPETLAKILSEQDVRDLVEFMAASTDPK